MKAGSLFFHANFEFHDGGVADKFVLVLGGDGEKIVTAKTTSQGHHRRLEHGCQASDRFPGFLLTKGCCAFLSKNTWVCYNEFYEFYLIKLRARMVDSAIYRVGELEADLARDAQACAVSSDDISIEQEALVRASVVAL